MQINFTKAELNKNATITPDWYDVEVLREAATMRGNEVDCLIEFKFLNGPLAEDERTIEHTMWVPLGKGKGFVIPYMAAILKKSVKEITEGLEKGQTFGFALAEGNNEGKKLKIQVVNEMYENRPQNRVKNFLPEGAEVPF